MNESELSCVFQVLPRVRAAHAKAPSSLPFAGAVHRLGSEVACQKGPHTMNKLTFLFPAFLRFSSIVVLTLLLPLSSRAEPAMWVVRDADSTIYIIGTVHLLRHEMDWNATKVTKAVSES